jgi:hypothetical protein
MPNLNAARIHHSYLSDWTAYALEHFYKLCNLCIVGPGTYVELRFFHALLRRCPSLEKFEYHANQGMQGWEPTDYLRLRRTSILPLFRRVALCARNTMQRPTCGKVQALTAEQVQFIIHSIDIVSWSETYYVHEGDLVSHRHRRPITSRTSIRCCPCPHSSLA